MYQKRYQIHRSIIVIISCNSITTQSDLKINKENGFKIRICYFALSIKTGIALGYFLRAAGLRYCCANPREIKRCLMGIRGNALAQSLNLTNTLFVDELPALSKQYTSKV
jgi:hypothetical protein